MWIRAIYVRASTRYVRASARYVRASARYVRASARYVRASARVRSRLIDSIRPTELFMVSFAILTLTKHRINNHVVSYQLSCLNVSSYCDPAMLQYEITIRKQSKTT